MPQGALAIAATGMEAQELNVEVIADNIAHMNTTGHKESRAEFSDMLYQVDRAQGVPQQGQENIIPEGVKIGLGVKTVAVRTLHRQGTLQQTGNPLDLALNGNGWFQITGPGGEVLYTRAGTFNTNATGQIVTVDGYTLDPAMTVPQNTLSVTINQSGQVFARISGQQAPQLLGQITLANFANNAGLDPLGGNLFRATEASGNPVLGVPADPGFATVHQGYLEASNVEAIKQITALITAQRGYEMNSKVVQASDKMLGTLTEGIR